MRPAAEPTSEFTLSVRGWRSWPVERVFRPRRGRHKGLARRSPRVENRTGEKVWSGLGDPRSTSRDARDPLSLVTDTAWLRSVRVELRGAHEAADAPSSQDSVGTGNIRVPGCQPLQEVTP
jgi:hypothetical protein